MLFLLFNRQGEWKPIMQPKKRKGREASKWYPMNQAEQITGKQKARMVAHKSAGANYREAKSENGTP